MVSDARRDTAVPCDGGTCTPPPPALLVVEESDPYDYGERAVDSTTPHVFSVVNGGGSVATNIAATPPMVPFSIHSDACTGSLPPGARCMIVVGFAPTGIGDFTGQLQLGYDDGSGVTTSVSVSLEGSATTSVAGVAVTPSGVTALAGARWQLLGSGGTPPYRFSIVSGGGSVTMDGRFTSPDVPDTIVIRVVDDVGGTADATIVVVESIGPTDRFCLGEAFSTAPSGRITDSNNDSDGSGDYENLEDCQYVIRPPTSAPVEIVARMWDVERMGDYDWLEVFDGETVASPALGHWNGDSPLTRVVAPSGAAYLHWVTDRASKHPGFELVWRTQWSAEVGILASPAALAPGGEAELRAVGGVGPYTFEVVSGGGSLTPATGDAYTARFTAGAAEGDQTVRVTDVDGTVAEIAVPVLSHATMCSDTISNAARGALYDSGGRGGDYANGETCSFSIAPGADVPITLTPLRFRVEGEGIIGFGPYDLIRIYDGADATGALIGAYEGNDFNAPVTATSGSMFIEWTSDSSLVGPGYHLVWR
jgi:hypothetical protein